MSGPIFKQRAVESSERNRLSSAVTLEHKKAGVDFSWASRGIRREALNLFGNSNEGTIGNRVLWRGLSPLIRDRLLHAPGRIIYDRQGHSFALGSPNGHRTQSSAAKRRKQRAEQNGSSAHIFAGPH